uniref:Uncharacterized protein n=1 Tax=Anguilla anguilla TaxID=7936 RepID=A0A0E9RPH3_ANGAN
MVVDTAYPWPDRLFDTVELRVWQLLWQLGAFLSWSIFTSSEIHILCS